MNKKGLTDVILVLVLSGIAVALIFIGIIYTYTSLACYTGVDLSQKFMAGGTPGQFANAGIELLNINTKFTNLAICENDCDTRCTFDTTCLSDCQTECAKYQPEVEYVSYSFRVVYRGASESIISIIGSEKQTMSDVDADVFINSTPSKLGANNEYTFSAVLPIIPNCEADFNVSISAEPSIGVINTTWWNHTKFCVSPEARDVNVIVNDVSYNSVNVTANVSITGSDVGELCPQAIAGFYVRRNSTMFSDALLVNTSNRICSFVIDTNVTRLERNNWYNDYWKLRTTVNVLNDVGPLSSDELVSVLLDFSNLGFDANITDCTKELVVTKSDGINTLDRYVVQKATDNDGHCIRAEVWFNYGELSWANNTWKKFYVYSTYPNAADSNNYDSITNYLPKLIFSSFANAGYKAVNTTPTTGKVALAETC